MCNYNYSYNYSDDIVLPAVHAVSYIRLKQFATEYDMTAESIMRFRREEVYPDSVFIKNEGEHGVMDRNWFERRWKFQHKVKMFNQEVYHLLADDVSTDHHF